MAIIFWKYLRVCDILEVLKKILKNVIIILEKYEDFCVLIRITYKSIYRRSHMNNGESSYRRVLDGDESAFDDIMELYREPLTRFIDDYVKDFAVAEDIAIDGFTYILVHKHRYNFKTSLKTYLFMLGRSRAIDFLRRRKRFPSVDMVDAEKEISSSSPEEQMLLDERKNLVREGLSKLPSDMREALTLVYFEELSYEETARVMKKSKKQIDNLLYRSKEKLRSLMGEEGELLL